MSGTIHVFIVIQGSTLHHSILITQERKTIMHNIICYTTYLPEGTVNFLCNAAFQNIPQYHGMAQRRTHRTHSKRHALPVCRII